MSPCGKTEAIRDYAFNELPAAERQELERHLTACAPCAAELDDIRLTTAVLRALPEEEIPQRIAFVSDKVFEPSPVARFFSGFWNSAARMGFASACLVAGALTFSAVHRPAEVRTVIQTASGVDVTKQLNEAVAQAVARVRAEDAKLTAAALEAANRKHEQEHRALLAEFEESMGLMQERLGAVTTLASLDVRQNDPQNGAAQ